ncbi:hypothetical protein RhiirA5_493284 [Rhizophagus irregularis]|uniref:Uncharacterized protein n=1 Tax=Rhizophagus irregularis TaxID=588596 RepID=A0A2N0QDE1_9GLOM|nr:hypothetical protein RhiirA5_493284 [Rhizophagus irregularis]
MTRGYSLEKDLRLLINNPKYSDIEILYLQDFIMKGFKNTLEKKSTENYSPELLSKFAGKMPLTVDNILLNLLVEAVATIPLNTIEFGRLSIAGLQYLLSCTYEKEKPFATREYELFRYSAILVAKQVSNDAFKTFLKRLPTLDQLENSMIQVENEPIPDYQKIAKELEPLIEFIDFRRIKGSILVDIIEPLEIVPTKIILNVYRQNMNKRTCAFTVNGTKYPEVPSWNNLPSKLYPVASLCYPGQFRIQPHKKNI